MTGIWYKVPEEAWRVVPASGNACRAEAGSGMCRKRKVFLGFLHKTVH